MAMSMNPYQQGYGYEDDYELKRRARSRDEYEYLLREKKHRMEQEMYAMPSPVVMPDQPKKATHLNTKLLLTKGA